MKKAFIVFLLAVALGFSGMLYAQDEAPHIFNVVTWESVNPEGGSSAERDSLLTIFRENGVNKNEFIVNQTIMTHLYGSNSSDYVVMSEHKSISDMEKAQSRNLELFREFMPDDKERAEFFDAIFSYFGSHSDEIYQGQ